jgi:aminoglycoside 3-N-acetyltransferase
VPVKTFLGFLNFEDMTEPEKQYLDKLGVRVHWGAPMWLQHALFASSGKRTVSEICRSVGGIDPQRLCEIFAFLEKKGLVRFRPYLRKEHITSALQKLCVARGETALLHSSLSEFGYVAGGADTVIDAVLEVLGNEGTLMLPTFTFSWMGAPPYDKDKTPSILGAIPNVFWRRNGVIRSDHPTHSFAAVGKHAAHLVEGHDPHMPPIGREGPIGKLVELDGKILMLCRKGANTAMHAGECWNGVPYIPAVCQIIENGVKEQVLVSGLPWHARFDRAYEILFEQALVRTAELGEGTVYLMRAADAVEAQARVVRETPELLVEQGCECQCCENVRKWIDARKRRRK